MTKLLDHNTLTADDVFAAAERAGVVIDEGDWAQYREDGTLCGCPMTALAIDLDPVIRESVTLTNHRIQRTLQFPHEFVRGLTDGFDHTPEFGTEGEDDPLYLQGWALGQACLKRIRPDLFVETGDPS